MTYKYLGVDKSVYDGEVDWVTAYDRGIRFASIRASAGTDPDPLHYRESENARAAGVEVQPYCWFVPKGDAIEQARVFLNSTKGGTLPPLLDLEDYRLTRAYTGVGRERIRPWLNYVEAVTGIKPMIYSSPGYIKSYLSAETWISEYPLIIANYDVNNALVPKPWTPLGLVCWQFGDGRDASYYGFRQAKGCALYVWNESMPDYVKAWVSNGTPPAPKEYTSGVAIVRVNVRADAGTQYPFAEGQRTLVIGQSVTVLETRPVGNDLWVRIGDKRWAAAFYGGKQWIELR